MRSGGEAEVKAQWEARKQSAEQLLGKGRRAAGQGGSAGKKALR
jgi:hypothetical protein